MLLFDYCSFGCPGTFAGLTNPALPYGKQGIGVVGFFESSEQNKEKDPFWGHFLWLPG